MQAGVISYLLYRLDTNNFIKEIARLRDENERLKVIITDVVKSQIGSAIGSLVAALLGKFL